MLEGASNPQRLAAVARLSVVCGGCSAFRWMVGVLFVEEDSDGRKGKILCNLRLSSVRLEILMAGEVKGASFDKKHPPPGFDRSRIPSLCRGDDL